MKVIAFVYLNIQISQKCDVSPEHGNFHVRDIIVKTDHSSPLHQSPFWLMLIRDQVMPRQIVVR